MYYSRYLHLMKLNALGVSNSNMMKKCWKLDMYIILIRKKVLFGVNRSSDTTVYLDRRLGQGIPSSRNGRFIFIEKGGSRIQLNLSTRRHSSRMRTIHWSGRRGGGGVCLGGVCPGVGVFLAGGGGVTAPVHAGIDTPPVNRMTDACENITFPQKWWKW